MQNQAVPIFIISLKSAKSRREYISKNFKRLKVDFNLLDATEPQMLPEDKQNSAIAVWDSHMGAMSRFLSSNASFACIFEDDIDLENLFREKWRFFKNIYEIANLLPNGYSILQLGTVSFRRRSVFFRILRNMHFLIFGYFLFDRASREKLRLGVGRRELSKLSESFTRILGFRSKPVEGFGTGTQAYIVNREAARFLVSHYENKVDWNPFSRYSMDTFLEEQSRLDHTPRELRTVRLSKMLFEQRSIESMNTYFPNPLT